MRQLVLAGFNRGLVHLLSGEHVEASALLRENAELCLKCGDRRVGGVTIDGLAALEAVAERMTRAATLWGAGLGLQGSTSEPDLKVIWDRWVSSAEASLGRDAFDAASRRGTRMSFERAVAYALDMERDEAARSPDDGSLEPAGLVTSEPTTPLEPESARRPESSR